MREVAAGILVLTIGWGMTYEPPPAPMTPVTHFNEGASLDPTCCIDRLDN